MDMSEVCLLIREYRPRVDYKYVKLEDIQRKLSAESDVDI